MYTTGIPACDALREIAFTGNIIPQSWYKIFVKRDLKNPKPHLLAINVLADIVYWYRPAEVRDERSGEVVGYRKKFAADLLQRSYAQIAEQFGCSEGQAKDAIVFLEEMGVVRREFRTIEAKGMKYNNILFLDLNADRLRELTYPAKAPSPAPESVNAPQEPASFFVPPSAGISPEGRADSNTPVPGSHQRGVEISTDPVPEFHQYTENTIQETTTENSTKISAEKTVRLTDGALREHTAFSDVENQDELIRCIRERGNIPALDLKRTRMLVHWLCEYEHYTGYAPACTQLRDEEHLNAYKLFVDCLCVMLCSSGQQVYSGEAATSADVRDAVQRLAPNCLCGDLDEFALMAVDTFCDAMESTSIRNVKGYMKSVIWNGFAEFAMNRETF